MLFGGGSQKSLGVGDVFQHLATRFFSVSLLNGRENAFVKAQRAIQRYSSRKLIHAGEDASVNDIE